MTVSTLVKLRIFIHVVHRVYEICLMDKPILDIGACISKMLIRKRTNETSRDRIF